MVRRIGTLCLLALWYLTGGACGGVTVGPFYPPHPVVCSFDGDCGLTEVCRFLEVDTLAICVPGASEAGPQ